MKPDSVGCTLSIEGDSAYYSQGSLPDFRHRCRPAAQLAEFELSLLDLLCQLDATDHDRSVWKLFIPASGEAVALSVDGPAQWSNHK
jgi:hypothetical protein